MEDGGIDADADVGVACFDPLQRRTGCESTFGHNGHRQPATTPGVLDVGSQLAQGPSNSGGRVVWSWHGVVFVTQNTHFM